MGDLLSMALPTLTAFAGVLLGYWIGAPPSIPMPPPHQIADLTPPTTAELKRPDWIEAP